jgi:acetylornithine deacetylase/succinyl-diaminopimelate desuccinylase-like protein
VQQVSEKPPWRVAIEQFERSIGAPLEEFVKTDEFADLAANAAKGQANMQRELEVTTNQWLHSMNLPTAQDISELRAEIAELRKEVHDMAAALAPANQPPSKARPAKKPAATRPTAKRAQAAKRRKTSE